MADIFLSWFSPDKEIVGRLRDRLTSIHLDVWEYEFGMDAGADIDEQVKTEIADAEVAIICLSGEAVKRPWFTKEHNYCQFAQTTKRNVGEAFWIIPVKVDSIAENEIPQEINRKSIIDISTSDVHELNLVKLAKSIRKFLGQKVPVTIPVSVFAMTEKQYRDDFSSDLKCDVLREICKTVGMPLKQNFEETFSNRYGPRPEDFCPFETRMTIADFVHEAITKQNKSRLTRGFQPIIPRWFSQQLMASTTEDNAEDRDEWRQGSSVLFVDSISTLYTPISKAFQNLPESRKREMAALVWIPPYAQHTVLLEKQTQTAANLIAKLGDTYRDWSTEPKRWITFDTSTSTNLSVWLYKALREVIPFQQARQDRTEAMRHSQKRVTINPEEFAQYRAENNPEPLQ